MADDDFDIQRLAAYLHVDPAQVARLADRGRLPGRKVAGQWRFSPAAIHHWLEERMGLSSDDELKQMETALRRPPGGLVEAPVSLADDAAAGSDRDSAGRQDAAIGDYVDV